MGPEITTVEGPVLLHDHHDVPDLSDACIGCALDRTAVQLRCRPDFRLVAAAGEGNHGRNDHQYCTHQGERATFESRCGAGVPWPMRRLIEGDITSVVSQDADQRRRAPEHSPNGRAFIMGRADTYSSTDTGSPFGLLVDSGETQGRL